MADVFSPKKRSWIMSRIKGRDTRPEKTVRKIIKSLGFRIRKYDKKLPGNPDVIFPTKKKVIFVNGCFWHGHKRCKRSGRPSTNIKFWNKKIDGNIKRDVKKRRQLNRLGWDSLVVWQCWLKNEMILKDNLKKFISGKAMREK